MGLSKGKVECLTSQVLPPVRSSQDYFPICSKMIHRSGRALIAVTISLWAVALTAPSDNHESTAGGNVLYKPISNDNATRAAMYWRHMIDRHPQAAAQASMYWRVLSAEDPEGAATAAMEMRKSTASDPEGMAQTAFLYQRLSSRNEDYAQLALDYWRKMAANDPEVTARSAMYWQTDPEAAMYW